MIEPKELRIGNYVEYRIQDELDDRKEWWELSIIDSTDLQILESGIDDDYRAIPLTEEILLKLGYIGNEPVFSEKSTIFTLGIHKIWKPFNIFLDEYYRFEIKYLHQLQNLYFALTGEELMKENGKEFWERPGKRINTGVIQLSGDAKAEYIFSERDVIKNFLTEIKDDIESIDCGCSDCIGSFISGVNTVIKKYGLELKLNGESSVCSLGLDLIDKTENL